MSTKEANAGEIRLYRERPECYVVRIISTPNDEKMWQYECKILKVLDTDMDTKEGEVFTASESKECGNQGLWSMWKLTDSYAADWLKRCNVNVAEIV